MPPLNALRAFEAGGRHLSFTKAAEELHVTQAAISHQVKALEEYLGRSVFRRLTRRLVLTEEGRILLPVLSEAFDRIAETAERVRRKPPSRDLTVTLTPSFGSRWLVGRLGRFCSRYPDVDLRLHHSVGLADFETGEVDIGVRYGAGDWPGLVSEFLVGVDVVPVCSPALLEGAHPLRSPEDLKHHSLLHEEDYEDWVQWLIIAGAEGVEARRGTVMDEPAILLQAAIDGLGVALGDVGMIEADLAAGRLVKPFDLTLEFDHAYYVVYPQSALEDPKVKAFRDFLLEEVARDR